MNRRLSAFILVLGTAACAALADETPPVRHKLTVVLRPAEHQLSIEDEIALPPALSRAGITFGLDAALQIRSSDPAVTAAQPAAGPIRDYALATAPADGIVRISYSGTMNYGLSEQKEEYTRGFRQSRGMVGPEGVYLNEESGWVPRFGEGPVCYELTVQAPEGWHVISAGKGTSRGADGRAHWESEANMEGIDLVGGPLHMERDTAGTVEVLTYLHQSDPALSRKYLDATARYIEMYRKLIGPYPYSKFALVENFWETGYGLPSFTLLGPQVIRFPFILTSSYPHEILHNWWGNGVFVDYSGGNWSEGLTAYLADCLIQEQQGQGAAYRRSTLQKYRDHVKAGRDFPLSEFRERHSAATEAVGYGKALMLFHMLRRQLGDDGFRAGLATLYREQRGKKASFADVRAAFEHAANKPLEAFFKEWVTRTGAPALALADVRVEPAGGQFKVVGELKQTQAGEPFSLDVPLYVRTESGLKSFVVAATQKQQPFELTVDAQPLGVAADPMFDVFRNLDPRETPPSIGQIFGEPEIVAVLPASAADESKPNPYRELIKAWQSDEHHIKTVIETELKSLPDDQAVWIFGRENHFAQPMLTEGSDIAIAESSSDVKLAGQTVPFANHSLVVVRRHTRNIEKAVGWLVIDPPAAAAGTARKLPHYGKYSYLAFEGDEPTNVVKGQWETSNSPMVVDFHAGHATGQLNFTDEREALAELPPVFSAQTLMEHVNWLASPERNGRGLGTPELTACAEYIRQHFESAGLKPGGDNGTWFQHFTVAKGPAGTPVEGINVIGILPGSRPDWAGQSVVLSAHYDHLGHGWPDVHTGDEGKVHPGADDNASGVAVLLELARNLAAEGPGARNLVVIAFSGEEAGRAGSKYYVEHPRFPLTGLRGVINLDTVGRLFDRQIEVLGTATADEWQHIFRGCGFVTGVKYQLVPAMTEASDQASFIEKGVPGVQIFTGAHADYHRPTDTPDKIDAAGLVRVATFVKEAVTYLLERDAPLTVRIAGTATAPAGSQPAGPGAGARKILFGVVPDFDFKEAGVRVASLVPGSPAEKADLRAGDILVRLGDQEIKDLTGFSRVLKTLTAGQEVEATVVRDGAKVTMKVTVQQR